MTLLSITGGITGGGVDRPILFSGPMVRAILEGRKTQTRRVMTPQPDASLNRMRREIDRFRCLGTDTGSGRLSFEAGNFAGPIYAFRDGRDGVKADIACPQGAVGGRLWVRETWNIGRPALTSGVGAGCGFVPKMNGGPMTVEEYRNAHPDFKLAYAASWDGPDVPPWRPSIHMPRWASRLTLASTDVRVERLLDISGFDAFAEGYLSRDAFLSGPWCRSLPGDGSGNPWVWVIEFNRIET